MNQATLWFYSEVPRVAKTEHRPKDKRQKDQSNYKSTFLAEVLA